MLTPYNTNLPSDLRDLKQEIEGYARGYGLDFYETIFEVIDADDLNEIAAYGGFPTRYPHWSFGMAYEELRKSYEYGLSKIYEMVINNDPCYAYLMRCNHTVDQKLVMAHVYGHCLAPETTVETIDGAKLITEVSVGEHVLTHTGQVRPISYCARRWYRGKINCILVSGSVEPIRVTYEHPVYILGPEKNTLGAFYKPMSLKYYRKKWIDAGRVGVGAWLVIPRQPSFVGTTTKTQGYFSFAQEWADSSCGDDQFIFAQVSAVWQEDYDGWVYNFSVEGDESYTLGAGMVVHNCDFFKNNAYFGHTNRKMMDEMANHGARIRRYAEKFGEDEVETFVDRCMSIDDLIDIHSTAIRRREEVSRYDFTPPEDNADDDTKATRFKSKTYMDDFLNPRGLLKAEEEEKKKQKEQVARSFPEKPEKDVLLFLIEHAPIKPWQRDVLSIIRDEAYYFTPQGQTKIMNEGWACLLKGSLIYTNRGLRRIEDVVEDKLAIDVSDGQATQSVRDWAAFPNRRTLRLRTRRGLEVEGSVTHRLLLPQGEWKRLDELKLGDRVAIAGGAGLWAQELVRLDWQPRRRVTLQDVAHRVGCDIETVIRYRQGVRNRNAVRLAGPVAEYDEGLSSQSYMQNKRRPICVPDVVDEKLAAFLGYLTGDGHISAVKRTIGLTTGDEDQADRFIALAHDLFGVVCRKQWEPNKWRVKFSSQDVQDFLIHLGLPTGFAARHKTVPDVILRSPEPVVVAFLRAYYDCDGYAGRAGVILSTSSEEMSKQVQLLLLNFGILSRRRPHKDGCWHVHAAGQAAQVFQEKIGFGLTRNQQALRAYVEDHTWFKKEGWDDEIVSIEPGFGDVYDITVESSHRYAAQGFINHNSYWHSTIMTAKALHPSELIDYADHHSGTMAMHGPRLNPYKLGIELLRDIEMRWNTGRFGKEWEECDDLEKKRKWDKQLGLGRQKIFEVRRIHNDITFIDTFLTPEFCVQHKLFSFAYQEQAGQYIIESRTFEKIKQRLLFSLTNFGKPWIYVVDGNHRNRGELMLRHMHQGVDLKIDHASEVLANIQSIWGRPVHLQTTVDGKASVLSFDGSEHSIRSGGDGDDSKRSAPAKTR